MAPAWLRFEGHSRRQVLVLAGLLPVYGPPFLLLRWRRLPCPAVCASLPPHTPRRAPPPPLLLLLLLQGGDGQG